MTTQEEWRQRKLARELRLYREDLFTQFDHLVAQTSFNYGIPEEEFHRTLQENWAKLRNPLGMKPEAIELSLMTAIAKTLIDNGFELVGKVFLKACHFYYHYLTEGPITHEGLIAFLSLGFAPQNDYLAGPSVA